MNATIDPNIRTVTVVGVGLLGGSIGLAIRAGGSSAKIVGVGRRQTSLDEALQVGAVDEVCLNVAEGVAGADLVILATPVGAFNRLLTAAKDALKPGAIVTDVGSTKAEIVAQGEKVLSPGGPFIGSHPMAGSEHRGPTFARADLFTGATCILTPTGNTPPELAERAQRFWQALGMRVVRMSPADHDQAVARISHLPQVLASLLMQLPSDSDLDIAATGFRDSTRLAGSDPEMWRDIIMTNRQPVLAAIETMTGELRHMAGLIEAGDADAIEQLLASAKQRRLDTIGRKLTDRRISAE